MLVLDAYLKEPLDQSQHESITRNFIEEMLSALHMLPLGPLGIYPAADLSAPGWSFIQPITTSHIGAHYFEKPGRDPHIRMDVYSCKSVDWHMIIRLANKHFNLKDWRATFIDRQIDENPRTVLEIAGEGDEVLSEHLMGTEVTMKVVKEVSQNNLDKEQRQRKVSLEDCR